MAWGQSEGQGAVGEGNIENLYSLSKIRVKTSPAVTLGQAGEPVRTVRDLTTPLIPTTM